MTVHIQTDTPHRPYTFVSFGRAREFPVVFVPENLYVESTDASQPNKTVSLKNPRETALMIQNIKSSQAWIQPVLHGDNVVYPWRAADIELIFQTDQMPKGRFNENLIVEYIDHKGEIRTIKLPVSGDGNQVYTLAPERFFFGQVNSGEENTKVLVLKNLTSTKLQIEKTETDIGTITVKRQEKSNNYQLTLTLPQVLATGALRGEVQLRTSHPTMHLIKIPVFAFVTK
ncbi:hypothetical protein F4054_05180 [Candidatus Poribacteria bacterium]|nr:hypothetical protein [Candidatus Poribacteria bacterium]MYG08900.1 hypothetical protein [Candidatus Poribacteria bacterium]MYK21638.1 hypothetical protein [Candidatus Poribacteria bacterium]